MRTSSLILSLTLFACHQAPSVTSPTAGTQATVMEETSARAGSPGNTTGQAGRVSSGQAGKAGSTGQAGAPASQAGHAGEGQAGQGPGQAPGQGQAGRGLEQGQPGQGQAGQAGQAGSAGAAAARMSFQCPAGPFGAPVPAGAKATRIAGVPPTDAFNDMGNTRTNLEGAVWIGDKLYVSEFPFVPTPTARVLALDPASGTVSVAIDNVGTNGMAVDTSGALIVTDHKNGVVARMPFPLGMAEVLTATFMGKRFNSPNDLTVRSDGTIYFSDPDYQAPSMHPQDKTRVYHLSPTAKGAEPDVIDDTRSEPNGVTLSPDEKTLYVAGADGVFSYPVLADGSVMPGSGKRLNAYNGSADGMGMDCAGNLYLAASNRVAVLSPDGKEVGSIDMAQAESVTNVAFGGAEHKTLFITSMGTGDKRGVFRVELSVPGLPY